jgi:hypothetical protein
MSTRRKIEKSYRGKVLVTIPKFGVEMPFTGDHYADQWVAERNLGQVVERAKSYVKSLSRDMGYNTFQAHAKATIECYITTTYIEQTETSTLHSTHDWYVDRSQIGEARSHA